MNDVLKIFVQLRNKAHNTGENVGKLLAISTNEIPVSVFGMIFNKLTLGLELLSHYYDAWGKKSNTKCLSVKEARQENAQRVIMIQRMIFVETMSSIEFCTKEYIKKYPLKIGSFKNRIYLGGIMNRSKEQGVILYSEFMLWDGCIKLRNTLVHNNGFSEKTLECNYPNCKLNLQKNKMIQGNLKLYPNIIDWLLDSIKLWIIAINKK